MVAHRPLIYPKCNLTHRVRTQLCKPTLGVSLGFPRRKSPGRKNSKEIACVYNLCKLGLQKEIKRCERPQQQEEDSGGRRQIRSMCMKGGLGGPSGARPRGLTSGRDLHPEHVGRPLTWRGTGAGFQDRGQDRRIFLLQPTAPEPGACSQSLN